MTRTYHSLILIIPLTFLALRLYTIRKKDQKYNTINKSVTEMSYVQKVCSYRLWFRENCLDKKRSYPQKGHMTNVLLRDISGTMGPKAKCLISYAIFEHYYNILMMWSFVEHKFNDLF